MRDVVGIVETIIKIPRSWHNFFVGPAIRYRHPVAGHVNDLHYLMFSCRLWIAQEIGRVMEDGGAEHDELRHEVELFPNFFLSRLYLNVV